MIRSYDIIEKVYSMTWMFLSEGRGMERSMEEHRVVLRSNI